MKKIFFFAVLLVMILTIQGCARKRKTETQESFSFYPGIANYNVRIYDIVEDDVLDK